MITVEKTEWGWSAVHPSGRYIAHSKDRAWLDSYLADLDNPPSATVVKHTVRFWAVDPLEGGRTPRKSDMRSGDWGWDATCSCGWDSNTGGSKMPHIDRLVKEHK